MVKFLFKESLAKRAPMRQWPEGFRWTDVGEVRKQKGLTVVEFTGAGSFADAFYERQQYEVDAGRDEEPLLYPAIYSQVQDSNLPEVININTLGPGGVVFERVTEGGEVKFLTVGEGSKSVTLYQYATGLEYTQKLIDFNQTWEFSFIERQVGVAYNALMNHIHFNPILAYSYAAANQTAAHSDSDLTLAELYLRTIEDAITNSRTDTTNPRRGPYDLLCSTSDLFMIERALAQRIQDGANPAESSAIKMIRNVIAYDGWTGTRGLLETTYSGVTAGTAYLCNKGYSNMDFRSYVKIPFRRQQGDGDLSRFIVEQQVFDTWFGVYSNPVAAVEEITWPTGA